MLVTLCGLTREDPDGIEHLILAFFALASTTGFFSYPFIAYCFSDGDIELYNHLLYFFQTFLPTSTALIVGWPVTGMILNLVASISFLFLFVIGTIMTAYVVSQTLWMTKIRELW